LDAGVKGEVMKASIRVETQRELKDLISIGPAMLRDFELLGIRSIKQLAKQDAKKLYAKLGRVAKQHQDICVLDTFEAAVAQAKNPRLAVEKCQWWWWSEKRKKEKKRREKN
jgi:nucleotidyltransferase/DNA polymerase involved in DNA repair